MPSDALLLSPTGVVATIVAVLATAACVHRIAPAARRHNVRLFVLLGIFLCTRVAAWLLGRGAMTDTQAVTEAIAETLGYFTIVAVSGVVFFDLALPGIGVRAPTIVYELAMALLYTLTALGVMRRFGIQAAHLVTTSAVVTAIVALSMQATLGNVIGGMALQLERSVRVGDWIQFDNGTQGIVREIRWRHTVFETRDWDTIIVPNSSLLASSFTVLGKLVGNETVRREAIPFNVDNQFSPTQVIAAVEGPLRAAAIENVATSPAPQCLCIDLVREQRASMATYAVRYWLTNLAVDEPTRSRVRTQIHAALKRAGIPLAAPPTAHWLDQEEGATRKSLRELDLERRLHAVRVATVLTPLHGDELTPVAERLRACPFAAGEEITREGDSADFLYIIVSGSAEVLVDSPNGRQKVAEITGPTVVGEMGLLTGAPRSASVIATSAIDAYRLDKEAFQEVLAKRPSLGDEIATQIAAREATLQSRRDGGEPTAPVEVEKARLIDAVRRFFGGGARS